MWPWLGLGSAIYDIQPNAVTVDLECCQGVLRPRAHAALGAIYYLKGDMKAAIADLTRAIELFPSYLAGSEELMARNPRLAKAHEIRGLAKLSTGDLSGAQPSPSPYPIFRRGPRAGPIIWLPALLP